MGHFLEENDIKTKLNIGNLSEIEKTHLPMLSSIAPHISNNTINKIFDTNPNLPDVVMDFVTEVVSGLFKMAEDDKKIQVSILTQLNTISTGLAQLALKDGLSSCRVPVRMRFSSHLI